MAEPWDDSLKIFINENPQDFASWLLGEAQVKKKLQTEFKKGWSDARGRRGGHREAGRSRST
ncbi:MAG TPA: hypothetical protein VKB35_14850 [Ktedonobacteraceae bacterium]|nr:hypothetical protein [Ktedonobacteraceae bacterium]